MPQQSTAHSTKHSTQHSTEHATGQSIVPTLRELERAFGEFATLFPRPMPLPVLTIQTNGRRSDTLGWFWDKKWKDGEHGLPEINISAEYLSRGVDDVAETLLHEMVHYCNALMGVSDCSRRGYHNRRFRDLCEKVGLNCEQDGYRGWSHTSLTPELQRSVDGAALDPEVFRVFRRQQPESRPGSKLKLWQCGCGDRARVAIADFHAQCMKCGTAFELVD